MKSINPAAFGIFRCALVACVLLCAGCASTNSNGRKFDDTTSIHVIPLESTDPGVHTQGAIDLAVEAAVAIAKVAINAEAKKYEAASEASLLWTNGFSANPAMIVVIRTFEAKADFETQTIKQLTNIHLTTNILEQAANRLAPFKFKIPEKWQVQFLNSITNIHKENSKVSFIALMLAYKGPDADHAMYLPLLGYSYPVLKAKNSWIKVPFNKWHSSESVLTISLEGAQGYGGASYKIQRVVGPKTLIWPRGKDDMGKWQPEKNPDWPDLLHQAPGIRSVPYQIPQGPLEITATLVESSDMKKTLESLGDRVGKLKLGDFKD